MRALQTTGFSPSMLGDLIETNAGVRDCLLATDHGGKNIWWHLLYHYGYRSKKGQEWMPLLRERVPLHKSARSNRGLFIDHIFVSPTKQWHEFFPKEGFERMVYALPNNTHDTWWGCNEEDGKRAANWMLGVRNPRPANMRSLVSSLARAHEEDPHGRAHLPMPLRGSLMLLESLYAADRARVDNAVAQGTWVYLTPRAQTRLRQEAKLRPGFMRARLEEVMQYNEDMALRQSTPQVSLEQAVRRL